MYKPIAPTGLLMAEHPHWSRRRVSVAVSEALNWRVRHASSGLGVGAWIGADKSFFLIDGLVLVMGVLFVYVIANVAVFAYYFWQRRSEFNIILHILFPLISTGALIYALVYSFIPFPASPYKWAPLIDGIWLLMGITVLTIMWFQRNDRWLLTAGAALGESEEADAGRAVRQA
jgi:uncharacterized integral membrane protein